MRYSIDSQKGAALIVSLVLLVIALLLSLSSMQASRLAESMSGNYRASERALMAAEYGAAEIMGSIYRNPVEDYDIEAFFGSPPVALDQLHAVGNGGDGTYYMIRQGEGDSEWDIYLVSVGVVVSGDIDDDFEIVAQREVAFSLRLEGLGDLAAINPVCPVDFRVPSNPSGVETEYEEEVSGVRRYKPAISVGNRDEARLVVSGIMVQGNQTVDPDSHSKVTFVPDDPDFPAGDGVYHASDAVDDNGNVNYDGCPKNNRMCAYIGGVSTSYGAPILGDPLAMHQFIDAIFRDSNAEFHSLGDDATSFVNGKVNVYTDRQYHVVSGDGLYGEHFEGRPLAFDKDLVVLNSGEENEAQVARSRGGEIEGEGVFYGLDDGVAFSDVVGGDEYLMLRHPSSEGVYFPSTQDYYEAVVSGGDVYSEFSTEDERYYDVGGVGSDALLKVDGEYVGVNRLGFSDNNNFSEKYGVLVIDGNAEFSGRPNFSGLIIVLGDFAVGGGGNERFRGAVVTPPYFYDHENHGFRCQASEVDTSGGGNHKIVYDKQALDNAFRLLSPAAQLAWLMGNDPDSHRFRPEAWIERMENKESVL
jgi:hypothetical protein